MTLREDARGWRVLRQSFMPSGNAFPSGPTAHDLEHAKATGYLFDPIDYDHDHLISDLRAIAARESLADCAISFVASLSSRRLFLRSFLPSIVVGRSMPSHGHTPMPPHPYLCTICGALDRYQGEDLNVYNFERHMYGGVRHLDPLYIWFCLDRLTDEGAADATERDWELLRRLLTELKALAGGTGASQAESALKALPSNRDERHTVIEILSVVSILENPAHPGFLNRFVPYEHRDLPPRRVLDRGYPAEWWTADHGVNQNSVFALFPDVVR